MADGIKTLYGFVSMRGECYVALFLYILFFKYFVLNLVKKIVKACVHSSMLVVSLVV